MKNFIISSICGRCGTAFLSSQMNKSKMWTVEHEPNNPIAKDELEEEIENIQKRFDQNYYGEVNSHLRFFLDRYDVEKCGFIIRNPYHIYLSLINRYHSKPHLHKTTYYDTVTQGYTLIPKQSENVKLIIFEEMVKNKEYLKEIFDFFGVYDVDIDKINLKNKINKTKNFRYRLDHISDISFANEYRLYTEYRKKLLTGGKHG